MATNIPPIPTITATATSAIPSTNISVVPSIGPSIFTTNIRPNALSISGPNPTIQTDKNKIDLDEMAETMQAIKERLLILTPAFEKHEKYPMLKQAYEHYKLVEKMCSE